MQTERGIAIIWLKYSQYHWKQWSNMSKAIADRADAGMLLMDVTKHDLDSIQPVLETNVFQEPQRKISIYKNRGGKFKGMYLWCKADMGTCRIQPMFATTWNYELISINDLKITIEPESAFDEG